MITQAKSIHFFLDLTWNQENIPHQAHAFMSISINKPATATHFVKVRVVQLFSQEAWLKNFMDQSPSTLIDWLQSFFMGVCIRVVFEFVSCNTGLMRFANIFNALGCNLCMICWISRHHIGHLYFHNQLQGINCCSGGANNGRDRRSNSWERCPPPVRGRRQIWSILFVESVDSSIRLVDVVASGRVPPCGSITEHLTTGIRKWYRRPHWVL